MIFLVINIIAFIIVVCLFGWFREYRQDQQIEIDDGHEDCGAIKKGHNNFGDGQKSDCNSLHTDTDYDEEEDE